MRTYKTNAYQKRHYENEVLFDVELCINASFSMGEIKELLRLELNRFSIDNGMFSRERYFNAFVKAYNIEGSKHGLKPIEKSYYEWF